MRKTPREESKDPAARRNDALGWFRAERISRAVSPDLYGLEARPGKIREWRFGLLQEHRPA